MSMYVYVCLCLCMSLHLTCSWCSMGWLSLKLQVSFAKEPYKRDDILQKRPIIWRSLLIVATRSLSMSFVYVAWLIRAWYDSFDMRRDSFIRYDAIYVALPLKYCASAWHRSCDITQSYACRVCVSCVCHVCVMCVSCVCHVCIMSHLQVPSSHTLQWM